MVYIKYYLNMNLSFPTVTMWIFHSGHVNNGSEQEFRDKVLMTGEFIELFDVDLQDTTVNMVEFERKKYTISRPLSTIEGLHDYEHVSELIEMFLNAGWKPSAEDFKFLKDVKRSKISKEIKKITIKIKPHPSKS